MQHPRTTTENRPAEAADASNAVGATPRPWQAVKHEIICITRYGFSFLHTEGGDFAAKVTALHGVPGQVYDPRVGVTQELLIPRRGRWGT